VCIHERAVHTQSPLCMCAAVCLCARAFLVHYTSCAATGRTRTLTRTSHAHTRSLCIHERAVYTQICLCIHACGCESTRAFCCQYTSYVAQGVVRTQARGYTCAAFVDTGVGCEYTSQFAYTRIRLFAHQKTAHVQ